MLVISNLIGLTYRNLMRPVLFRKDPELVHDRFVSLGSKFGESRIWRAITRLIFNYAHPSLEQEVLGIKFKNPVGLSAGFDKDANLSNILQEVGFGFENIGSVTWQPYEGNPRPRLHRLPKSKALVVYYGLKNIGVVKIARKISKLRRKNFPLSISIAKTNSDSTSTPETGIEDYYQCLKYCETSVIGDFYTINISCPNTFGGEPFTTPDKLDLLLQKLSSINTNKPRFIKMPINLRWEEFSELLKIIVKHKFEGVIIGNLNKDHNSKEVKDLIPRGIQGGISGKPTWKLSNDLIGRTYKEYKGQLVIIGVGGIFSAEDAYTKIKLGASLVQLITGMIYEGPQLIGDINRGLVKLLKEDGYSNIEGAIGSTWKH